MVTSTHPLRIDDAAHGRAERDGSFVAVTTALLGAAVAGLLVGTVTSYGQSRLPSAANQLANSGAAWTVVAFAVALLYAGRRWVAVTAGATTLFGEVIGYYAIASPLRGIATTTAEQLLWAIAALWIGPAAGCAAWAVRRGESRQRLIAGMAVAGLVAGEGAYEVHRLGYVAFGWAEIAVAAVAGLVGLVTSRAGWASRLMAIAAAAFVAVSTYGVYTQTILSR